MSRNENEVDPREIVVINVDEVDAGQVDVDGEELDVGKLQQELKKYKEKEEKTKIQKRKSYKKNSDLYNRRSSVDIINSHLAKVPEDQSEIVDYVNGLFEKIKKSVKTQVKQKNYPDFDLPK